MSFNNFGILKYLTETPTLVPEKKPIHYYLTYRYVVVSVNTFFKLTYKI